MASFDPITKTLLEQKEINANQEKVRLLRKKKIEKNLQKGQHDLINQSIRSKEVSSNKILTGEDYLICTRRANDKPITGYSLINSAIDLQPESFGPSIIPHHFICLRPRKDIGDLHIPFVHLLLDSIIENQLVPLIEKGNKGILNIKTLKELKVTFPTLYENQEERFSQYQNLKSERNKLDLEIINLKGSLSDDFLELNNLK